MKNKDVVKLHTGFNKALTHLSRNMQPQGTLGQSPRDDEAFDIAEHMSHLKSLGLAYGLLTNVGMSQARDVDHPDRASRRENERTDRSHEDDCYDRNDDSSPRDYQLIPGGQDVGHHDPSMFDPYSGPGMRGSPPFGSDMLPPSVLMPVPGAGPLGPFVPTPPEVAMRMMREQGGPAPFHPNDNNGSLRGRKYRSGGGPSVGGMMDSPTILPFSQGFYQDPRRIRNYSDLDAPEDEVTVIDYRTF